MDPDDVDIGEEMTAQLETEIEPVSETLGLTGETFWNTVKFTTLDVEPYSCDSHTENIYAAIFAYVSVSWGNSIHLIPFDLDMYNFKLIFFFFFNRNLLLEATLRKGYTTAEVICFIVLMISNWVAWTSQNLLILLELLAFNKQQTIKKISKTERIILSGLFSWKSTVYSRLKLVLGLCSPLETILGCAHWLTLFLEKIDTRRIQLLILNLIGGRTRKNILISIVDVVVAAERNTLNSFSFNLF